MIFWRMSEKPILYHSTPNKIEGDQLVPNPQGQKTCVHYQFLGTPQQSEHEGQLLFAGTNQAAAYAYAFKLHDPDRMEGDKKGYCFMCNVGVHPLRDGSVIPLSIIADRANYFERLKQSKPTIYKIPANNAFHEVHDKDGKPMGEWISGSPVNIADCVTVQLASMDEAMEKGVQFFFLKEGITKNQWYDIAKPHYDEIERKIARYKDSPETKKSLTTKLYLQFIKEMVDAGMLQHYNQERGILPLNLETQTLSSPVQKMFAQTIPPVKAARSIV
jgi:hypothetical protein